MPEFIDVELQSESSSDSEWLHLSAYWGCHNHLIFSLNKTPLGETGCLSNPLQSFWFPLSQNSQLA